MTVIVTLAFAAGVLSCLLAEWLFWPRIAPQLRGRDGRFMKERPRYVPPVPDLTPEVYADWFTPGIISQLQLGRSIRSIRAHIGEGGHLESDNARQGFELAMKRVRDRAWGRWQHPEFKP